MRWTLFRKASGLIPPEADTGHDRESARQLREKTEASLAEEQARTVEVRKVAATSRSLRERNNFSARITDTFRGHNGQTAG